MTDKNKIQELGEKYGIDQETIDEVKKEYPDEPPLLNVKPNVDPKTIPNAQQLQGYIDRIERLEEEKHELALDINDIYREAKGMGFDVKVMKQVIKLRKMNPADRAEATYLLEQYKLMLGIED